MANYIYRDKDHHHDIDCPHLSRLVRSEEKRRARNRRGQQTNKCEKHKSLMKLWLSPKRERCAEKPNEDG
jgi:hypothetical protein